MKKVRKLTVIFAILGLCTLVGVTVLGYWKITGSTGNILTMSSFKNQIEEKYRVPDHVESRTELVDKVCEREKHRNNG